MKGSNSRQNFNAANRFSNLFHIQGGMVTDSDLSEAAAIAQARDEDTNSSTIRHGVPARSGMVGYTKSGAFLREGAVFAAGKRGRFTTNPGGKRALELADAIATQVDLPGAPALPETGVSLVYADLWERPIFAAQDNALTDAGLHGTETSYRTRTMVQLKTLPVTEAEAKGDPFALMAGHPAFRASGNARLKLSEPQADVDTQGCDPCADQITIERTLPNALWRLEIVEVTRDKDHRPTSIRLAWSMENAARIETNTARARKGLERDGAVYQFFSEDSESWQGWFAGDTRPVTSTFTDQIDDVPTANSEEGQPYVRRWDGTIVLNIDDGEITEALGTKSASLKGKAVVVSNTHFSATVPFDDKTDFYIGDHWLVELRRFAPKAERLALVSSLPQGPKHAHCPLMFAEGDAPIEPSQALRQITGFPSLTELRAGHVGYRPPAGCDLYGSSVRNVDQALDVLCGLDATRIKYTPDPDCAPLQDSTNVSQALSALCKANDKTDMRLMLRTMMDWGVVCGLRLAMSPSRDNAVNLTKGTALDRTGVLEELNAQQIALNDIPNARIHGSLEDIQEREGHVCLSVELRPNKRPHFHLSDRAFTQTLSDLNWRDRVRQCARDITSLDESGTLAELKGQEQAIIRKIMTASTSRNGLALGFALTEAEMELASKVFDKMRAEFEAATGTRAKRQLTQLLDDADSTFGKRIGEDSSRDPGLRTQYMVAYFTALAVAERDSQQNCACVHGLPDCPEHDADKPALVPLGCLTLSRFTPGNLTVSDLSDYGCRKQSRNWRTETYLFGDGEDPFSRHLNYLNDVCRSRSRGTEDITDALQGWAPGDDALELEKGSPFWPPNPGISNSSELKFAFRGLPLEAAIELAEKEGMTAPEEFIFSAERGPVFDQLAEIFKQPQTQPLVINYDVQAGDTIGLVIDAKGLVLDALVITRGKSPGFVGKDWLDKIVADKLAQELAEKLPEYVGEIVVPIEPKEDPRIKELQDKLIAVELENARIGALAEARTAEIEGLKTNLGEVAGLKVEMAELKGLKTEFDEVEGIKVELAELKGQTSKFDDVSDVKAEVAEIRGLKAQLEEIAKIQSDVTLLKGKTAEIDKIAEIQADVAGLKVLGDEVKVQDQKIRENTPIEDVLDSKAVDQIKESTGIFSMGQLSKLDQDELLEITGGNRQLTNKVLADRDSFLKK
ncbi:hypothetical protein ACS3SW_20355 [Roseobacteraceae bacterium S113]